MKLLRAVFSIGLVWAAVWAVLALAVGTIIGIIDPGQIDAGEEPFVLAPLIGAIGFVCGVCFAMILVLTVRSRQIVDASTMQIVIVAGMVSGAVPVLAGKGIPELVVIVPLGIVSACASIAVTRRLHRQTRVVEF